MGMMKTTTEIVAALRTKLEREPTFDEIEAERIRLGKLWYASLALSAATVPDKD
jgi:hypothetical protein